jgi:ABC-type polysaccharide/polyol phosphate transport system ATPase subunit
MNDSAITANGIRKTFRVPMEHRGSLREHVTSMMNRVEKREFVALDDISFSLDAGEFLGVIGPNGGGKSTLMKIISGIYAPDGGRMTTRGSIAPFLELGIGFNGELSARDNIYVNGTILGIPRAFLKSSTDEILSYAGLSEFGRMKVKNFSSGMRSRLAFAVASRVDADIYLMDEVLAVGDYDFNVKCLERLEELKGKGKTIVLVSHDLDAIKKHCNRCLLIQHGKLVLDSSPEECISRYLGPQ